MLPLINIGLRAARIASEQLVRSMERLDLIHEEGQELDVHLRKQCEGAERTIAYEIHKAHPEQGVTGSIAGEMNAPAEAPSKAWRISAIDGLDQYAHSLPMFTLTMACYEEGKLAHSIIICPSSGEEFCASKGRGAQLNGRRIRASKRATLKGAQIFGGGNQNREDLTDFDRGQAISRNLFSQGATNYAQLSNNMALAYTAAGRLDALWHSSLDDTADAGLLLILEAGGLAADFTGGAALNKGELVCANPKLLKLMLKTVHSA
ncbi:inositol monophosphatase family protein [Candidatus Njordibacter sp. Uisw_039]|jgi:myo-inositol-1(or 4)-monophosphatase|uniref:inositol monophosphatase family protein n=1 Tax=Candidatus Njordibacter sp. Uisw_039 TaxID=3230972 RepID=UPI003A2DAC5F